MPEEFAAGHPLGAVSAPLRLAAAAGSVEADAKGRRANPDFLSLLNSLFPNKEGTLLMTGCGGGTCTRGATAVRALSAGGYRRLRCVIDGWRGWREAGLPSLAHATPAEARARLQGGDDGTACCLLDVRTPEEFASGSGSAPGAINVPFLLSGSGNGNSSGSPNGAAAAGQRTPNPCFLQAAEAAHPAGRDGALCVTCGGGSRGPKAAAALAAAGFKRVLCLEGGLKAWRAAGFEGGGSPAPSGQPPAPA